MKIRNLLSLCMPPTPSNEQELAPAPEINARLLVGPSPDDSYSAIFHTDVRKAGDKVFKALQKQKRKISRVEILTQSAFKKQNEIYLAAVAHYLTWRIASELSCAPYDYRRSDLSATVYYCFTSVVRPLTESVDDYRQRLHSFAYHLEQRIGDVGRITPGGHPADFNNEAAHIVQYTQMSTRGSLTKLLLAHCEQALKTEGHDGDVVEQQKQAEVIAKRWVQRILQEPWGRFEWELFQTEPLIRGVSLEDLNLDWG